MFSLKAFVTLELIPFSYILIRVQNQAVQFDLHSRSGSILRKARGGGGGRVHAGDRSQIGEISEYLGWKKIEI